jgi:hypothetical protein
VFATGATRVAVAGPVTLTLRPSRSARKALRTALRRRKGVPVSVTLTFQSSRGGTPTTHVLALVVKLRKH